MHFSSFGKPLALLYLGATLVRSEEGGSLRVLAKNEEDLQLPPSNEAMLEVTTASEACEPNPCYNDGHCVPLADENQNTTFEIMCFCSIGFYGAFCNETDDALTLELEEAAEEAAYELEFALEDHDRTLFTKLEEAAEEATYELEFALEDHDRTLFTNDNDKDHRELEDHDRTLFTNDNDKDHRELQTKIENWVCVRSDDASNLKGTVKIWWGYTKKDASWACNEWKKSTCKGACTALPIKTSSFACYTIDPMIHAGTVEITWGHQAKDGTYACNQCRDPCKAKRNCFVRDVAYVIDSESNRRWNHPAANTCTGNGGSCNAVYLKETTLHLKSFKNDKTWAKVEGCGGAFSLQTAQVSSEGSVTVSFGTTKTYKGWEGCCGLVGETLQKRGLITDGYKCAKNADALAVEMNLIGKDACWKRNTRCLAGTTCNFCCNGNRWVWDWFGHHCN
jgi:hypothetical protein